MQNYLSQFSGELVGISAIADACKRAGFDVIETSEHRYGCKVSVKSLGIDMRGTPQSDLERRLRVVGLELQVWNELDNSMVVREMRL